MVDRIFPSEIVVSACTVCIPMKSLISRWLVPQFAYPHSYPIPTAGGAFRGRSVRVWPWAVPLKWMLRWRQRARPFQRGCGRLRGAVATSVEHDVTGGDNVGLRYAENGIYR